jgi:predicted 3-demethylubiquinone-9 3-methyltransferase (glyoxalase superfamily)
MSLTPFLWFDAQAEEAARFYTGLFPDSRIDLVQRAGTDYPAGKAGDVLVVGFTLLGSRVLAMNGGPGHPHTDAFSFQVDTETQEETDRYWDALTADGGAPIMCGWCRDRWGLSWQITPRQLSEAMSSPDPAVAKRVMEAMMTMVKIDIAAIEAAAKGT